MKEMTSDRIIAPIPLWHRWVPQKHTVNNLIIQFCAVRTPILNKASAPKDSRCKKKQSARWLKNMKWGLPIKNPTRSTINKICGSEDGYVPKRFRNVHSTQETSNNSHKVTVLTFCHTILFRGIGTSKLLKYPIFVKCNPKVISDIFAAIIRSYNTHNSILWSF